MRVLLLSLFGIAALNAQSFEVATIKPTQPGTVGVQMDSYLGKLTMHNVNLRLCLQWAYGVQDYQISGAVPSERYDIQAKAASPVGNDQMKPMLQALLAERFKLAIHRETKEGQAYALLVAKSGSKLRPSKPDTQARLESGHGHLVAGAVTMSNLARDLSRLFGRPVSDETGLKGLFDFTLDWTPDASQPMSEKEAMRAAREPAPSDSSGPSIFTALQEQLGLKLESRKAPMEILVIDHVEKPSEN